MHSLEFDSRMSYGSREHFFHFMWGYLLPALRLVMTVESSRPAGNRFLFQSCGPLMDGIIREVGSLCHHDFCIVDAGTHHVSADGPRATVPRWDICLLSTIAESEIDRSDKELAAHLAHYGRYPELVGLPGGGSVRSTLAREIAEVKRHVEDWAGSTGISADLEAFNGCFLLLERSPPPAYYAEGGGAEIPTYGTSRRALRGVPEAAAGLRRKGIPAVAFEPGAHGLTEQIEVFRGCAGIVGIKGAEFANIIWMKPRARVVLICPPHMKTPPVQRALANLLGLQYAEIESAPGAFPAVDEALLERHLR